MRTPIPILTRNPIRTSMGTPIPILTRITRNPIRISFPAAACALAALAGALAGCGSSTSTGTSADPASVTPATAPVYVGAVVRPTGSLKSNALAAGSKLTHQSDPYTRLLALLQTPGSPVPTFSSDVAPWLGPNAGLFVISLGSSESLTSLLQRGLTGSGGSGSSGSLWPFTGGASGPQGAIVLDTTDLSAARTFVSNAAAHAGAHATSYRGVSYQAGSGDAFAVVDRFVVLGTESGVHAVIDTTQGGASLKSDFAYSKLQSVAPSGTLAHVYASPSARGLTSVIGVLAGGRPLNISLVPSADSLALDADAGTEPTTATARARGSGGGTTGGGTTGGGTTGGGTTGGGTGSGSTGGGTGGGSTGGGLIAAAAAGNHALSELPGESWLAAGLGNVGATAGGSLSGIHSLLELVSSLGSSGAGVAAPQTGLSVKGLLEGLLTPLSVLSANTAQARQDYLSWMGDAGVFASGTSVLELKGGVVIDSTNPSASRAAVTTLGAALRSRGAETTPAHVAGAEAAIEAKITGLPLALVIAAGRGSSGQAKFVLGLGSASVQYALDPPSTMLTSSSYSSAASALGEGIQPSIAVDFSTFVSLLEAVGLAEDPTISPFLPYLRDSSMLSGGGKQLGGGIERLRLVLGLQ